ncbi:DUF1289 domain-containing protein [Psychromonas sp. RZ22]|uniref:DUF1289 domain-containing protein n=1 Tax=Psychromonas algarum TaxID=2555643 RepID=UPI001067B64D|nr:DUF1289 domain-containing protein [Psychromonas sp. RZ22]TEW53995.1 DUF1289 domain-containing protein [Psychromonas sp. RZ22]
MSTPASPCICNCCLNKKNICVGCFRSLSEITEWSNASDLRKRMILMKTKQRSEEMKTSF